MKVAIKFNRCVEFTLPSGATIVCKVLGEKGPAKADAERLVAAFSTAVTECDTLDETAIAMAASVINASVGRK